jgi:hypothetical protein
MEEQYTHPFLEPIHDDDVPGRKRKTAKITRQAKIKEEIHVNICMTSALSKDEHRIELEEKIRQKIELEKTLKKLVLNQMRQQRHREKKRLKLQESAGEASSFEASFNENFPPPLDNFNPLSFPDILTDNIYFQSLDGRISFSGFNNNINKDGDA